MNIIKVIPFENEEDAYKYLNIKLLGLITSEKDPFSNFCNVAALLGLLMKDINWVGFYFIKNNQLKLGPFSGKPACTTLSIGRGVCGKAVKEKKMVIVNDVNIFEGHVACDPESKSEIVLPITINNKVVAVLDVDSPILNRFTKEDEDGLERVVETLKKHVDWEFVEKALSIGG